MSDTKDALLIILAKVPELGKVKTRLAKTVGDDNALKVYIKLLQHTHGIADAIEADKVVYFTDEPEDFDTFKFYKFKTKVQRGDGLGERMSNCFRDAFKEGYKRVAIIGSDCIQLDADILQEAFAALENNEFVVGPAEDGGYYLMGMSSMHQAVFEGKTWSEADVFLDTLLDIKATEKPFHILQTLSDVDREEDLNEDLRALLD